MTSNGTLCVDRLPQRALDSAREARQAATTTPERNFGATRSGVVLLETARVPRALHRDAVREALTLVIQQTEGLSRGLLCERVEALDLPAAAKSPWRVVESAQDPVPQSSPAGAETQLAARCFWDFPPSVDQGLAALDPHGVGVTVVCGLLGRLRDPRHLLAGLRRRSRGRSQAEVWFFEPCGDGDDSGPSADAVREWTQPELATFIASAGFELKAGWAMDVGGQRFVLLQTTVSGQGYEALLCAYGWSWRPGLKRVVLLHADASSWYSGGQLAFLRDSLMSQEDLVLAVGQGHAEVFGRQVSRLVVDGQSLADYEALKLFDHADQALASLTQLLFFYEEVEEILHADYLGVGARIAQACRAGLLGDARRTRVCCFGTKVYWEAVDKAWLPFSSFKLVNREKVAIEQSDELIFPSAAMRELYLDRGYRIQDKRVSGFPVAEAMSGLELSPPTVSDIRRVQVLATRTSKAQLEPFLRHLAEARSHGRLAGVTEYELLGLQEEQLELEPLATEYPWLPLRRIPWDDLADALQQSQSDGLVVWPVELEGHLGMLAELLRARVGLVCRAVGALAAVFGPLSGHPAVAHTTAQLVDCLERWCSADHVQRSAWLAALGQVRLGDAGPKEKEATVRAAAPAVPTGDSISVIVPVLNTGIDYIKDLCVGLNSQVLRPKEVVFVDDGSTAEYRVSLETCLAECLQVTHRLVVHDRNRGLAAARNTGVEAVTTPYVATFDSDDVPLHTFLLRVVTYLDRHSEVLAVIPLYEAFWDGEPWRPFEVNRHKFLPVGDGVVAAQVENLLGHANAAFRVDRVRALGGWDASTKAMWEDWAFYLKAVGAGETLGVVPYVESLYRRRRDSMLRTYDSFAGMERLARGLDSLPRFEAFRLQAAMRDLRRLEGEVAALKGGGAPRREAHSEIWRAVLARWQRYPRFFTAARRLGKPMLDSVRRLQRRRD